MQVTRESLEKLEEQSLAPYAVHSNKSKGRSFPEDEPDYRTCFQRDRDRILHTTAFRRLEYKTQVFINHEGDYYRTRLTHTLEVVQTGRTIARALGANEDLVETICMSHDLGHPPFGHSGERVLSRLMRDYGGFDHNRQSFRIVTKLEVMGISIVDKPVQKYSVLFLSDEKTGKQRDHYNYALVQYAISALREPFDGWDVERTSRRQPHSRYAAIGRNDPCPCESGKKYKKCCLRETGVLRPHYEFTFEIQPPDTVVLQETFIE